MCSFTSRYKDMYLCDNQMRSRTAVEDFEYTKWLDPDTVPCYIKDEVSPTMNDKALYQLERAVDALKLMAEASLREEQRNDSNEFYRTDISGDVVFPTAWNDDVISFGEDMRVHSNHGNVEITTGTEGTYYLLMMEEFVSYLLGRYNNRDQAFHNPSKFAYIWCVS